MKFFLIFIFCVVIGIAIIIVKNNNTAKINTNGAETTGTVTKVFLRGKLPFCHFSYTVNGVKYTKKQDVSHHLKNKILNKSYLVKYEISNPKNAIIKLSN